MSDSGPLERAQDAIDEARDAASAALPSEDLSPPASADPQTDDDTPSPDDRDSDDRDPDDQDSDDRDSDEEELND